MSGLTTTIRNAVAAVFLTEEQVTVPTQAEFAALNTGYTPMKIRRVFGSFSRGMRNILRYTTLVSNAVPVLANALVDQTVAEAAQLSYAFAANSFSDDEALTYSATLADGSSLPGWITFTSGTRTFAGTAPAVDANTDIDVIVTATDIFGRYATGSFTITVTAV